MSLTKIVLRTLKRKKIRFTLAVVGLTVCIGIVAAVNISTDTLYTSYVNFIMARLGAPDIYIMKSGFMGIDYSLVKNISSLEWVDAVSGRLQLYGVAFTENSSDYRTCHLIGVNVESELRFKNPDMLNGSYQIDEKHCVISSSLSYTLNVSVGENITFATYIPQLRLHLKLNFTVSGVMEPVQMGYPTYSIIMNLLNLQLAIKRMIVNVIVLKVDNLENAHEYIEILASMLGPDYVIKSPKADALENLNDVFLNVRMFLTFISMFSVAVGVLLLANVLLIGLEERKVEIGILRSVGASRSQIFYMVLLEAFIIGILGTGFGLLAGIPLSNLVLNTILSHRFLSHLARIQLLFTVSETTLVITVSTGTIATFISAIYPAYSASKVNVIEALRPRMKSLPKSRIMKATTLMGIIFSSFSAYALLYKLPEDIPTFYAVAFRVLSALTFYIGIVLIFAGMANIVIKAFSYILYPFIKSGRKIVARELVRQRRRSALSFSMLSVGLSLMIFTAALSSTIVESARRIGPITVGSDIRIYVSDTKGNPPPTYIQYELEKDVEGVLYVSPIKYRLLKTPSGGEVTVIGVDPTRYWRIVEIEIVEGPSVEDAFEILRRELYTAIISTSLARNMSAHVGDYITLMYGLVNVTFKVAAITDSFIGFPEIFFGRLCAMYISMDTYKAVFGEEGVYDFAIKVAAGYSQTEVEEKISNYLTSKGFIVETVSQERVFKAIKSYMDEITSIISFFISFSIVAAMLGIFITIISSYIERRFELAILVTVGADKKQLAKMLLCEATLLSLIGLTIGTIAGNIAWWLLLQRAYAMNPMLKYLLPYVFPVDMFIFCVLIALTVSLLSSLYPAFKTARMNVVEALRYLG
ncbi:hypothetical protein DRO02_00975 [archaeon]|nr:MAG: hypothetical protein DRO21_06225 [archaeon]RLG65915.1 MAG: hypothetical protein DRO02_00975 [archaeon]